MLTTLLLATLCATTPSFNQAPDTTCGVVNLTAPLNDLAWASLYGTRRYRSGVALLARHAATIPGVQDCWTFADSGAVWTCWATWTDRAGNESCPSNLAAVNLTTAVAEDPLRDWRMYDIAGRVRGTLHAATLASALAATQARARGFYFLRSTDGRVARSVLVR